MPSAAPAADRALQEKPVIDVARPEAAQKIDSTLLKIVAASGMSPLKVMRDFLGLAFGPGRVSFADYEALRLFDSAFWAGADRRLVVGHQRNVAINQTINFRHDWWGMLDNKIATGSYLAAYGLPILPTVAVYCDRLKSGAGKVACDAEALRAILTDESNYPMFGKPAEGLQSLGSIGLRRYLPQLQSLETREGRLVPLAEFIEQVRTHYAGGYLLQKFVSPHAAIRALCGDRLATVRRVRLWGRRWRHGRRRDGIAAFIRSRLWRAAAFGGCICGMVAATADLQAGDSSAKWCWMHCSASLLPGGTPMQCAM
jgi:hypothetical protein